MVPEPVRPCPSDCKGGAAPMVAALDPAALLDPRDAEIRQLRRQVAAERRKKHIRLSTACKVGTRAAVHAAGCFRQCSMDGTPCLRL
jgi:hypothetical protein